MKVPWGWGGDEVVGLARPELQSPGRRAEVPEGDGEVAQAAVRLVTDGHDLGPWVGDPAGHVLLPAHAVHDVALPRLIGTDEVHLVRLRARVHIHDVVRVVDFEHRIGRVPVDKVCGGRGQAEVHNDGE